MKINEQQNKVKEFVEYWKSKGYEKGESQKFWLQLLSEVLGVKKVTEYIEFEDQIHIDKSTGFIDGYIPTTKVLIEQKSVDKNLKKAIRQSDGSLLTPFQQAKKYITELPVSKHPRYVVTCNFKSFLIYDMEKPNGEPEEILLEDLPKEYYRLQFLVDNENENLKKEMEVSIQAGEIVGKLYDSILPLYINPQNEETLKSLNMLCVRIVFCLYAEDAGIFGKHNMFHNYLLRFEARDLREALIKLFRILDTPQEERDPYIDKELAEFPYVNGGLFANESIEIPQLTEEIKQILLTKASENFDWSNISPTIFGAVFESTLNPETRRKGGMHYTSIENIHKLIEPLFLNSLKEELEEIKAIPVVKTRKKKLEEYQKKLSELTFLDPACGSGNFLTETYICIRKLENEVIETLNKGQIVLGDENYSPIQVSIGQFYGIEINDFAVTVAKTALWIAESQMMKQTEEILHTSLEFLPLKSYANIIEANALRIDWNDVVPKEKVNYIMGNPPFVGATMMNKVQKEEAVNIFGKIKLSNSIDYVGAWYFKASEYIINTQIEVAFVSTNSITQGEEVKPIWGSLFEKYNIKINFAHKTFCWDSEANIKAHVYCVIIGFSNIDREIKYIFDNGNIIKAKNISPYLIDSDNIIIESTGKPLWNVPKMYIGNKPADGGNLILSNEEKCQILKNEPKLKKWIKQYIGSEEFINNKKRYCFWLKDIKPEEIRKSKELQRRLNAVKEMRLNSTAKPTIEKAQTPHLFFFISQPSTKYLLIPSTSSENRKYIPIGFMEPEIIVSNSSSIISNATLYHFGILTSNVHNAWMRVVAGRLEMRYRYSNNIVYNTFPFPNSTKEQKEKIEKTAQAILDTRKLYPDCSLADLYDELTMPPELRKAHQENDKAVMKLYGFHWQTMTESECVAELMKMYQEKVKNISN